MKIEHQIYVEQEDLGKCWNIFASAMDAELAQTYPDNEDIKAKRTNMWASMEEEIKRLAQVAFLKGMECAKNRT